LINKTSREPGRPRPRSQVHIDHCTLRSVQMTTHELKAALRGEGCAGEEEVRFAVLENNGHVTVVRRENHGRG
jgi:uncharacterized membrane protein YcaP (DUF421 family)